MSKNNKAANRPREDEKIIFERNGNRVSKKGFKQMYAFVDKVLDDFKRDSDPDDVTKEMDNYKVALMVRDAIHAVENNPLMPKPTDDFGNDDDRAVFAAVYNFLYEEHRTLSLLDFRWDENDGVKADTIQFFAWKLAGYLWPDYRVDYGKRVDLEPLMNSVVNYMSAGYDKSFASSTGFLLWDKNSNKWLLCDKCGEFCMYVEEGSDVFKRIRDALYSDRADPVHNKIGEALKGHEYVKRVVPAEGDPEKFFHDMLKNAAPEDKNMYWFGSDVVVCTPWEEDHGFYTKKTESIQNSAEALIQATQSKKNILQCAEDIVYAMVKDEDVFDAISRERKEYLCFHVAKTCERCGSTEGKDVTKAIADEIHDEGFETCIPWEMPYTGSICYSHGGHCKTCPKRAEYSGEEERV